MSGFDQNAAFFGFNNLTPQQLNLLRQQNQLPHQQQQQPQQQQQQQQQQMQQMQQLMQQQQQRMPQLGLPNGFNQQQLQALMAQQHAQNGMQNNPMAQMMRPQQPQQQQQQQHHPQQPPPQQHQQPPPPSAAPSQQMGPTPTFAQLSHAIEQAKKGNLTQEQMIQLRQLITRQQAMQAQAQSQASNNPVRPGQPSQQPIPTAQNFQQQQQQQQQQNPAQRTPQMQAQARMMAGLQQVRPGTSQATPTLNNQGFLQSAPPPQQNQAQQPLQANQSSAQLHQQPPRNQGQQQQPPPPPQQQQQGLQSSPQQSVMGQIPGQSGHEPSSDAARNQQNPLNFLRLLHQRVTDIESKLASDLSPEDRQVVQQQHAEAKRLQSALLQRFNVQNAQQFAMLMQQGQQSQQGMPNLQQPQQQQQMHNPGLMNGGMLPPANSTQPQPSPVIRPPNRPASVRPQQNQFSSPMLNQSGLQTPHLQQQQQQQHTPQLQPAQPQHSPPVRPSPQMGGTMNLGPAQGGMPGIQGVPSLRPEQFMKALVDLMKKRGTPITSLPKVGGQELDLYRFYQIVQSHGGSQAANVKGAWPAIAMTLELTPLGSPQTQALGQALATEYRNYLAPFEETWQRAMHHQYQMSMAGAGAGAGAAQGQNAGQQQQFRPPQTQQPGQQQLQPAMMPPNQGAPASQQLPGGQTPRPPQTGLAGFNPPAAPILGPEHLSKLGMTQEQFSKAFLSNQLNMWRQQQQQQQQRQMTQGYQANTADTSQMSPNLSQQPNAAQQPPSMMTWPNQPRPMQQTPSMQGQQQPPFNQNMLAQQQQQAQKPGFGQPPAMQQQQQQGQPIGGSPSAPQGQNQARPPNMSQARFIPVSPEQLEQARAAMQKIDQELATQRPRLPIIQNIADDERDQILEQVQRLAPIQATVTALLPAFYAMNGNLEPAKRLKIMAFMYKDQYDLLPKKQCILRLADLDKLKMQMSRCISFVRSSNPDLAQRIVTSLGEQSRNAQLAPGAVPLTSQSLAMTASTTSAQAEQPDYQGQPGDGTAANGDAGFDTAAAMQGLKRGFKVENLKLPPNKRSKMATGTGKSGSPQTGESPKVAPSPIQVEDQSTPAGSTPAGKGGKKGDKGGKMPKATLKKGKSSMSTPTLSSAETDKKFKTSADIMAEVKREMAEAERKRNGGDAGTDGSSLFKEEDAEAKAEHEAEERRKKDLELAGRDPVGLVESTWQDLLSVGKTNGRSDNSLLGAPSAGPSASDGTDSRALESLLSLLGQDSLPSDMSDARSARGAVGPAENAALSALEAPLPSADADAGLDIDLFDFIEASAAGPDAFSETEADVMSMLGSGSAANASTQESEPPVETPELVASARLPGGGSGGSGSSTSSNSTANSLRSKLPASVGGKGLDFGSAGPSSTSPAELSSCDEVDLEKSPFVQKVRLDHLGLTLDSEATSAGKQGSEENKTDGQVDLGSGIGSSGGGDDWWDMDHFSGAAMGMGFASDGTTTSDQPWAVLS